MPVFPFTLSLLSKTYMLPCPICLLIQLIPDPSDLLLIQVWIWGPDNAAFRLERPVDLSISYHFHFSFKEKELKTNISICPRIKTGKIPVFGPGHHGYTHTHNSAVIQTIGNQNIGNMKSYRQRLAKKAWRYDQGRLGRLI